MRNPCGDYYHIALGKVMDLPALNIGSQPLAGRSHFASQHSASGDEGGRAVDNIENVRLLFMKFDMSVLRAVSAHDEKVRSLYQDTGILSGTFFSLIPIIGVGRIDEIEEYFRLHKIPEAEVGITAGLEKLKAFDRLLSSITKNASRQKLNFE